MECRAKFCFLAGCPLFLLAGAGCAEIAVKPATPPPCTEPKQKNVPASVSPAYNTGSPPVMATVPCMEPLTRKDTAPAANMLNTISISAPRVARDLKNVPATLSVISAENIQEQLVTS